MALTKVQFQNINTNLTAFSDPITITNFGNVGNRDIGEIFDRSQGSASNVAIIWQESTKSFRLGYTSSTGKETANLTITGNANVRVGNLYAESINWANGTAFTSSTPGGSNTQIQYNNNGSFAGATSLTTDGSGTLNAITLQAATIGNVGAGVIGSNITAINSFQGPVGVYGANTGSFTTTTATGNITGAGLTVNGTATVGSTLSATAGLQGTAVGNLQQGSGTFTTLQAYAGLNNTVIGNVTPSTAQFTTINSSGNTTISALTVNNTATIGSTLGVSGAITANSILINGTTSAVSISATGTTTGVALVGVSGKSSGTNGSLLWLGGNSNPSGTSGYLLNGQHTLSPQQDLSSWYGMLFLPTISSFSGNISSMYNEFLRVDNTASGNANVSNWYGSFVATPSFIAGTTPVIGSWSGYTVQDPNNAVANPTNAYGYRSSIARGTNRWGLYMSGTADNYILGNLGLGITTPTSPLHVVGAGVLTGNLTAAALTSNGSITAITTLSALGGLQATPIGNVTASSGQFTTISGTGNITGAGITSNGSITAITSLSALGGIQATPIGNVTASTGQFTSVSATGNITGAGLTVNGSATVGTTLGVNTLTVNTSANIGSDVTIIGNLYIGTGSNTAPFTTSPIIVGIEAGSAYTQAAIQNTTGTGSADWTAYANNGTEVQGWVDVGFTGNLFNDTNYTITGKNDGYIFANGVTGNSSLGGNLVIATGSGGATNDIVFATGGFTSNKEVMRFSNSGQQFYIEPTTVSTSTTSGALRVGGGVGIAGNLNVGTNLVVTGTSTFTGNILGNTTHSGNVIAAGFFFANGTAVGTGGGSSSANVTYNPSLYNGLATNVTTVATLIDSISVTGNTSINYTISAIDNTNGRFKTSKVETVNDGTNVYFTEYAVIRSNTSFDIATITSNISGGQLRIYAQGNSGNTYVSFQRVVLGSATTFGYVTSNVQGVGGPTLYNGIASNVTTAATLIDSISISGNTSVAYTISAIDNTNGRFKTCKVDTVNDGTNVYFTEYAVIRSNNSFNVATITSNISGGQLRIYAQGDSASTTVSFQRVALGSATVPGYGSGSSTTSADTLNPFLLMGA